MICIWCSWCQCHPHHFLLQWNPEWFTFLVPFYAGCPGKRPLNGCSSSSSSYSTIYFLWGEARNRVLDEVQIHMGRGNLWRKGRPIIMYSDTLQWAVQKMAEPIEMPFGLWTRMGPRNLVLCGFQIPLGKGLFWKGKGHPIVKCRTLCRELCKNDWTIHMPFGLWTQVSPRNLC